MSWIKHIGQRDSGLIGVLGDIEDRMPRRHRYRSKDVMNWAHETTHGLNSIIRNEQPPKYNAAYFLNEWTWVMEEPNITLAEIANEVPKELRGESYNLYLVQQRRHWNNQPLYLLDEFSAYTNGTLAGHNEGFVGRSMEYSFQMAIEFLGYLYILRNESDFGIFGDDGSTYGEFKEVMKFADSRIMAMLELGTNEGWAGQKHCNMIDVIHDFYEPLD